MRNLAVAFAGFLVGAALIVGIVLALPQHTSVTINAISSPTSMPAHMNSGGTMMSGGDMMSSAVSAVNGVTPVELTIQHVQRGCHVWSNGQMTAAMMRLHLKLGQRLTILDEDVDAHQMLQFAGPMHMRMGGAMMMNHSVTLSFMKKGVYRLGTKTVQMPGGAMDVKTIGPDNKLRLLVTVA